MEWNKDIFSERERFLPKVKSNELNVFFSSPSFIFHAGTFGMIGCTDSQSRTEVCATYSSYSLLVTWHKLEVVGWCDVVVTSHLVGHAVREVGHWLVHDAEDLGQGWLVLVLSEKPNNQVRSTLHEEGTQDLQSSLLVYFFIFLSADHARAFSIFHKGLLWLDVTLPFLTVRSHSNVSSSYVYHKT